MKLHALSLALGALLALSSCSIQNNIHVQRSRMDNYSKLYAERPRTILLMPVVNKGGGRSEERRVGKECGGRGVRSQ